MTQSNALLNSTCILIVDDDRMMRFMAQKALEGEGFSVVQAEDGEAALTLFTQHRPSLVLMDVIMPGLDGFSVCAQLRALPQGRTTPIIMMTALDDIESINTAYEVGATDFIPKPIDYLILGHRVRYMVRATQNVDALRKSEERLANAQRIARLAYWEWDGEQRRLTLSEELHGIMGLPSGVLGHYEDLFLQIHPREWSAVTGRFEEAIASGATLFQAEHRIATRNRVERFVHQEIVIRTDPVSGALNLFGTVQEVTERKKTDQRILQLAYFDALTGLPNRTYLQEYTVELIGYNEHHKIKLAVLSLDIDQFKRVNDSLGHSAGDQLLRLIAQRLSEHLGDELMPVRVEAPDPAAIARYGGDNLLARMVGDQFMILLSNLETSEQAQCFALRVSEALDQPFWLLGDRISISVSIGISLYPDSGTDVDSLFKNADAAMHNAKLRGRAQIQCYTEAMHIAAVNLLSLENDLRQALEQGEFCLNYQPRVDILRAEVLSMEALVRWHHPKRGLISPAQFIPLAEETGLIIPLGAWILAEACKQNRTWQKMGFTGLRMAINLSPRQFKQGNLAASVRNALDASGLRPEDIELEITEGALMDDIAHGISVLKELRDLGIRVALDDFGTGYSSLNYLRQFPLDILKIDQTFVQNMTGDPGNSAIVNTIIALSHDLDLEVVAEGVETHDQLAFLLQRQCNEVQGFLFSTALPADEFITWYQGRSWQQNLDACRS